MSNVNVYKQRPDAAHAESPLYHAGLDERATIFPIDGNYLIHPREGDHHAAGAGENRAAQARARAARDDRQLVPRAELHDGGDFGGRARQHHGGGRIFFECVGVALIDEQFFWVVEQAILTHDLAKTVDDF